MIWRVGPDLALPGAWAPGRAGVVEPAGLADVRVVALLMMFKIGCGGKGSMDVDRGLAAAAAEEEEERHRRGRLHERGDREVVLHAQRSAAAFYARQGFVVRGAPFVEAGIPHLEMAARLPLAQCMNVGWLAGFVMIFRK